jgi:hypothetical protein
MMIQQERWLSPSATGCADDTPGRDMDRASRWASGAVTLIVTIAGRRSARTAARR